MISGLKLREYEDIQEMAEKIKEYCIKAKRIFKNLGIDNISDMIAWKKFAETESEYYYLYIHDTKRIYIENNNGKFRVIKTKFKLNAQNERTAIDCQNFEEAKSVFKQMVNKITMPKNVQYAML